MSPDARKPAGGLIAAGLGLLAVALVTRGGLAGQTVFGLPGEAFSGLLFGAAIGILAMAVLRARRAR